MLRRLTPGARLPIGMPADGTDCGWETPPTITVPGMKATFSGRGSLRMMLLTAAMLVFVSTEVNLRMSPVTASMAFTLLTILTLGAETGTLSVFETAFIPSCRPSGRVKLIAAAAELGNCWPGGSAVTVTRKLTVTLSPGTSGPTGIPVTGSKPGSGVPPMMTLFGSNTACGGKLSVRFSTGGDITGVADKDREG